MSPRIPYNINPLIERNVPAYTQGYPGDIPQKKYFSEDEAVIF
jgi:hypothetical protein